MLRSIDHFIDGSTFASGERQGEVFDPNQGQVQASVRLGTAADLQKAVDAAKAAQPEWAATNPQRRARVMFKFKELVERNMDELAHLLSSEHGKVIADAKGDVQRGLEVIEFCCGVPQALKGEYTVGAGPGIDVYSMRQPLGIGAGITPFNFPAMIPMWMFGMAIACGNAFIVKPSERDPSVPVRLAELMKEAGLPDGILNVVHGDKEMVDAILDHPDIAAISFVGSSDIAQYIYSRGTANGKRVQAFGGAKNHGIVMPDADLDQVVNDLTGAAFGSAGERCMALPVVVPVGDDTADRLRAKLIPAIESLRAAVRITPGFAQAHNLLGILLAARGDIDEAIESFGRAIQARPGYARAYNNLGSRSSRVRSCDRCSPRRVNRPVAAVVRRTSSFPISRASRSLASRATRC
jgi:malonate-semialdehyde dehydrogenase (acetylating)/methylmalonate-semialdehyde dehydrogenase